jgi:8-oxo-dGTP pyrophosphatase MutT (NUDIX family)
VTPDEPVRVAVAVLVDPRGWLLLQERDEHAPVAPNKWGLVGGHADPGEDFESAVYRELAEETGLVWRSGLQLWFDGVPPVSSPAERAHHRVWVAATDLGDADIVVGEGRQILFVDPRRLEELDLSEAAAYLLPRLLASPDYARLL